MPFDPTRPIGPDNILWQSDMPASLQYEAEAKIADKEHVEIIRERIKRLERGERDPHVKDWSGAYYGDVYFLLGIITRSKRF